jgi:NADPH:quinone reductase-like Zn-dependent oxidoreductase
MKALLKVKDGPGNIALQEIDEPAPGPGEVKIKV